MSTTIRDQQALERYARQHERELRFLRHSPREERWIPFARDANIDGDMLGAVVGIVACSALLVLAMLFSAA